MGDIPDIRSRTKVGAWTMESRRPGSGTHGTAQNAPVSDPPPQRV
jgi:hypothetical protein